MLAAKTQEPECSASIHLQSEKAKCSHSGRTTTYLDSSSNSFVLFSVLMELYRGCAHETKAAVGTRFSIRFWCFHYSYHINVLMCVCVPTWSYSE